MSDWNPSLYLHFAAERSRPAVELLARVPLENIVHLPNPAMSFLPRAVTTARQSSTAPKVFALQRNGRNRHYYENQEKWRWRHREC